MELTCNKRINPSFKSLNMASWEKFNKELGLFYTRKAYNNTKQTLKVLAKDVDITVKPSSNFKYNGADVFVQRLAQQGEEPQPAFKMTIPTFTEHGMLNNIIINTKIMINALIHGNKAGTLYIGDKGPFPHELDKAIPRLEKLADGVDIVVLPEYGYTDADWGYSIFANIPGELEYTPAETILKPTFNIFKRLFKKSKEQTAVINIIKPIDFSYRHPYHGYIDRSSVKYSKFRDMSDLIVDVAKFNIENLKSNNPGQHHRNVRWGGM